MDGGPESFGGDLREREVGFWKTDVFGEAVGGFVSEVEDEGVVLDLAGSDGQLGEDGGFVFKLDGNVGVGEEVGGEGDDFGEFAGLNPVVVILGGPDLKKAAFDEMFFSAAVEEGAGEMPDFGDVEVGGRGGAIG